MALNLFNHPGNSDLSSTFRRMERDMNTMMNHMMGGSQGNQSMTYSGNQGSAIHSPRVDVHEQAQQITVRADLPGIPKENIHIEAHDGMLVLSAESKKDTDVKKGQHHIVERYYGQFSRSIPMPPSADLENVKAKYEDGVLIIDVAKKEQPSSKKITIQ